MDSTRQWIAQRLVGNPVYVLSAGVMMAAIASMLNGPFEPGQRWWILLIYAVLQSYEVVVMALATWILLRLVVVDDGATLLVIESLLIGGAFVTLDELLATDPALGLAICGVGLGLAAAKLLVARRGLGLDLHPHVILLVLTAFALPVAWVPLMNSISWDVVQADWVAFLAWWSLAGLILVGGMVAGHGLRDGHGYGWASAVLAVTALLAVAGHLAALHHTFLATLRVAYTGPVLAALGFVSLLWWFRGRRPLTQWGVAMSWLPFVGLAVVRYDPPAHPTGVYPPYLSPTLLVGYELVIIYAMLTIVTRRWWLGVHLAAVFMVAFSRQRIIVFEHVADHRGPWLMVLSFVLLGAGAALTVFKHRYRQAAPSSAPE